MTLRASGPEYVPLRTFRDDDLLDPGSDPIIALLGALSNLNEHERVVTRLMLRSLGPDWSQGHLEKAHKRPVAEPRDSSYSNQVRHHQTDVNAVVVLGVAALIGLRGYLWVRAGETWKAALMGGRRSRRPDGGGMGVVAHQEGTVQRLRPTAHQGEGRPHRLRRRDTGRRRPTEGRAEGASRAREGAARPGGGGLPALRPSRRSALQGGQGAARRSPPVDDASVRLRSVRGPERPGSP